MSSHAQYFDVMTLAGDADRSRAIVTLRDATGRGPLTLDEFADRVERAELARTFSDLEAVVADLPVAGSAEAPVKHGAWFSRLQRSGRFELAPVSKVVSVCGTIDLDLGRATLHGPETTLHIRNVFGTVTVLVPRGVHVSVDGGGPFGTREIDLPDTGPVGDAPRLRIRTSGAGGTLRVKTSRAPTRQERQGARSRRRLPTTVTRPPAEAVFVFQRHTTTRERRLSQPVVVEPITRVSHGASRERRLVRSEPE